MNGSPAQARPRRGPRPLAVHIAHAEWAWRSEKPTKLKRFYQGVKAYRSHPYRRIDRDRPVVWQCGSSRLLDVGPPHGWPILVVPSLINRGYILDLMPGLSLLDYLSRNGMRPFLLEWGTPAADDRRLSLDDLMLSRLKSPLDQIDHDTGLRPLVLGYCMGGTLATALACLSPGRIAGLALLATPWDFRQGAASDRRSSALFKSLAMQTGLVGSAPVDILQTLFNHADPLVVPEKFARMAAMSPHSEAAIRFVAVEDWLNDGMPLGAEIAGECAANWYGTNAPARRQWTICGERVRPERLDLPVCLAVPERDRIVPAASALALADALPMKELIRPKTGHIGMIVGQTAKADLWTPLLTWLRNIVAAQKNPWSHRQGIPMF